MIASSSAVHETERRPTTIGPATVVITAPNVRSDGLARVLLAERGLPTREFTAAEIVVAKEEDLAACQVLIVGSELVDLALLSKLPALRYVLRSGAGLDSIDIDSCRSRGIRVEGLPGMNAESVADFTFGLLIALARRITEADLDTKTGRWRQLAGGEVHGRTLGIVGYGRIGKAVARRAAGFGMTTIVASRGSGTSARDELDNLLRRSDFVSLHTPLTEQTRGLIGSRELQLMRSSAYLINTARGGLVDEVALYAALTDGLIAGAGLDVFASEPPARSLLLNLPTVIATPHAASYGTDTLTQIREAIVERVLAFMEEGHLSTTTPNGDPAR